MFRFAISCEKVLKFILKPQKKQTPTKPTPVFSSKQTKYNFNICIYAIVWMQNKFLNSSPVSHLELIQAHIHNIVVWAIVAVSKLSLKKCPCHFQGQKLGHFEADDKNS